MLVHKRTMGVLDQYWTGENRTEPDGNVYPVMAEYTLAGTGLDAADWWEVPASSPLGRSLRIYYPYCSPVTDEAGELIAVRPWPPWQRYGEAPPEELCPDRTPPKKRRQNRKSGLFAALLNKP